MSLIYDISISVLSSKSVGSKSKVSAFLVLIYRDISKYDFDKKFNVCRDLFSYEYYYMFFGDYPYQSILFSNRVYTNLFIVGHVGGRLGIKRFMLHNGTEKMN